MCWLFSHLLASCLRARPTSIYIKIFELPWEQLSFASETTCCSSPCQCYIAPGPASEHTAEASSEEDVQPSSPIHWVTQGSVLIITPLVFSHMSFKLASPVLFLLLQLISVTAYFYLGSSSFCQLLTALLNWHIFFPLIFPLLQFSPMFLRFPFQTSGCNESSAANFKALPHVLLHLSFHPMNTHLTVLSTLFFLISQSIYPWIVFTGVWEGEGWARITPNFCT